jgi:hypothetical protein
MSEDVQEPEEVEDDGSVDAQASADGTTPPYMSFTGFQAVLDKMIEHGPPDQIDRDFFGNASGSRVAQTMSALKFFGLVDDKKKPTPALADLVPPDTRKERMRKLIEAHYPRAVALGSTKATQAQLDGVFPAKGGTLRKAVTFYLQAAEFTGIPLSPYFSKSRPSAGSGGARRGTGTAKKAAPKKAAPPAGSEQPQGERGALDLDEKKSKYIDLLLKLADTEGPPNEGVLDRLHTVLGYPEVKKTPRRRGSGTSDEGGDHDG